MRPARSTIILLAVLLANAAAVLFFRFFTTVDGPMHVLHASLLEAPWATPHHMAHGITYDSHALHAWLGNRILALLLLFTEPERGHDIFTALVGCAVTLSAIAFLRAHGVRPNPATLWLAPLCYGFVLFMGLFHFMLGVAVCLFSVAWWKWRSRSPLARAAGVLVGAVLAWHTHRHAPLLLCAFFLPVLLVELLERYRAVPRRRLLLWGIALLPAVVLGVARSAQGTPLLMPRTIPKFNGSLLLQPLSLLDPSEATWLVRGIAALLFICVCAAVWARTRMQRALLPLDALLILALLFQAVAWLGNTPQGRQLLVAERCQWLALLMLVMWLAAVADMHRGKVARLIGATAVLALLLHAIRLVQAERSFADLAQPHRLAIEAAHALEPGSLVVPVMAEPHAFLQHLPAHIAIQHTGVLLAPAEHVYYRHSDAQASQEPWFGAARDPHWFMRHWREGVPKEVDHILFIGGGIQRAVSKQPWRELLKEGWRITFDNGYARIYTVTRDA